MKLLKVKQQLKSSPLANVRQEVFRQLERLTAKPPQGRVAIPVGSRGISQLPKIIRAAGDWLRSNGADPFLVPAMGSHNGATAEGQQEMIESLGITEAAMQMPIHSSMECVKLGSVDSGDVWMDRYCYESDGVLVINRVKLHTCFSGPVQSGLVKMLVVGMGKIRSAETLHSSPNSKMKDMLLEMAQVIIGTGKIWAGLAILEDGFDQTAELHALHSAEFLSREPELLIRHHEYFPTLPIDDLNVLVVEEIGKTFSGTGMDTNVIGFRGVKAFEDLERPRIKIIAAMRLAAESKGNAIGVGLADFITQRLRDAIDERKTFINVYTTGEMERGKIPACLPNDKQMIDCIGRRFGFKRWMFIKNTLHLDHLYVSEDLRDEVQYNSRCSVVGEPFELTFAAGDYVLPFGD